MAKRFLFAIPGGQDTMFSVSTIWNTRGSPKDHRPVRKIDIRNGIIRMTSATTVESDIIQLRSNVLRGQIYKIISSLPRAWNMIFVTFRTTHQRSDKELKQTTGCFPRNIGRRRPWKLGREDARVLPSFQSERPPQSDARTSS